MIDNPVAATSSKPKNEVSARKDVGKGCKEAGRPGEMGSKAISSRVVKNAESLLCISTWWHNNFDIESKTPWTLGE